VQVCGEWRKMDTMFMNQGQWECRGPENLCKCRR
jgi:hypothetical protein